MHAVFHSILRTKRASAASLPILGIKHSRNSLRLRDTSGSMLEQRGQKAQIYLIGILELTDFKAPSPAFQCRPQ